MCNCATTVLESVEKHVLTSAGEIVPDSLTGDFVNKVLRFDGKKNNIMVPTKFSYTRITDKGVPYKKQTHETINISMSYCPFCGASYDIEDKSKDQS